MQRCSILEEARILFLHECIDRQEAQRRVQSRLLSSSLSAPAEAAQDRVRARGRRVPLQHMQTKDGG